MTDTANAPGCAFEFNTQGKAPSQKTKRIPHGLYTVSWKDGGTSEVAIGMTSNGDNWMAPTNWLRPAMIHSVEGDVWGSFERLERINATHCDELVAAAYLDAAQRIEQCLWSHHWYIDGESVDPEDLSEGITKRTPDDARAAMTAYGERMKAEGASEAQVKIARLEMDKIGLQKQISDLLGVIDAGENAVGNSLHWHGRTPDWYVLAAYWSCYGYSPDDPRAKQEREAFCAALKESANE